MSVFSCIQICALLHVWCPWRANRSWGPQEFELPTCEYWESIPGLLEEQPLFFNNGDIAPSPLQILSLIFHIRSSCQRWKASTSVPAHDWNGAVYSPMSVLEVCTWCLNPESMSEAQHNQSHAFWPRNGSSILWWHCWPPSMGNLFRLFRHFVRCCLRALGEMSFIIGFAELCCFPGDSNLFSNIVR